jgi:hypothetical protein
MNYTPIMHGVREIGHLPENLKFVPLFNYFYSVISAKNIPPTNTANAE